MERPIDEFKVFSSHEINDFQHSLFSINIPIISGQEDFGLSVAKKLRCGEMITPVTVNYISYVSTNKTKPLKVHQVAHSLYPNLSIYYFEHPLHSATNRYDHLAVTGNMLPSMSRVLSLSDTPNSRKSISGYLFHDKENSMYIIVYNQYNLSQILIETFYEGLGSDNQTERIRSLLSKKLGVNLEKISNPDCNGALYQWIFV